MFWKILQWVQIVISLIREAEDELGRGRGLEKRAIAVAGAVEHLGMLSTAMQIGRCSSEVLASHVGQVVDGAVGVMNCFGVLRTAATPATATATGNAPPPPGGGS